MAPERSQQVNETRQDYFALPAEDRPAFLKQLRTTKPDLAAELETILEEQASPLLPLESCEYIGQDESADDQWTTDHHPAAQDLGIPSEIGRYAIDSRLGEGSMGLVYLAMRADDRYRKQIALKLMRSGLESESSVRRFRSERQILADLDHPSRVTRRL